MMIQDCPSAYTHLLNVGVHRWARSKCSVRRYSFMISNIAECFNACLLWARRLSICSLVEVARNIIEKWFYERRELAMSRDHTLTPEAFKKVSKPIEIGRCLKLRQVAAYSYRVEQGDRSFLVDLDQKICEYGEFQLDQMSCCHAASAIRSADIINMIMWRCTTSK